MPKCQGQPSRCHKTQPPDYKTIKQTSVFSRMVTCEKMSF